MKTIGGLRAAAAVFGAWSILGAAEAGAQSVVYDCQSLLLDRASPGGVLVLAAAEPTGDGRPSRLVVVSGDDGVLCLPPRAEAPPKPAPKPRKPGGSLGGGENVYIRGFGSFVIKPRPLTTHQ